ncbi:MAG: mitochondrial fission ELM1 family protein, partial [Cellvibrionaceae bacterium]|nr:mitochondrial fission ELM1 family protein [Cellvibrionaceae bacterium]
MAADEQRASAQGLAQPRPLSIVIVSDGKPGHSNQSMGLAEAIARLLSPARTVQLAQIAPLSTAQCLGLGLGLSARPTELPDHVDLVIAAGHRCHLSLLALAKTYGATSIVLMKPSLPKGWFDYVLVPAHDNLAPGPRCIVTQGAINRVHYQGQEKTSQLILIGGPSKHYQWDGEALLAQLKAIMAAGGDWQILSSRRTPAEFCAELSALGWPLLQPQDLPPAWLAEHLPKAACCWVSPDSVSMVYEALTAAAEVRLLSLPLPPGEPSRVVAGLQQLLDQAYVCDFEQWQQGQRPRAQTDFN